MVKLGNVMILGDSYSTFKGYIPEGFDWYYQEEPVRSTLCDVKGTWWHSLLSETDSNLVLNCSYSGTTICHTGYSATDCIKISFIGRFEKLIADGFFKENKIDTLFIFGGTNDSWAESPLGEVMTEGWQTKDLYNVLPAIYYLVKRAKEALPDTRIICVINTEIKDEVINAIIDASKLYGVEYIKLSDIDKTDRHPAELGMSQIKTQILNYLSK